MGYPYVGKCPCFVVKLAQHWSRWCRAELWCRLLSNKLETSVIVVYSPSEAEFMFPLDWQHNSIVDGDFTVESDRAVVVELGEVAVESKLQHLQAHGPLDHYRFYSAFRPKLLRQARVDREVQQFLHDFKFSSLEEAAQDRSSMNAVMCSVLSGDTGMLRLLAEKRADMNQPMHGLGDLGYYDTQTILMAATKSYQEPAVLTTLIELRADPNARNRTGLPALYMCRSPDHVKALLEHRAEMSHYALNGAASFAGPDTVQALLSARCQPGGMGTAVYGPLHALAVFGRSNRHAVESAKLLLECRADVNMRCSPTGKILSDARWSRLREALVGTANCTMRTRWLASMLLQRTSGVLLLGGK